MKRPERRPLPKGSALTALVGTVKEAIRSLPAHFRSATVLEGMDAGDLFSLNTALGGTIEVQLVESLNRMRDVWDPEGRWSTFRFERFAQTFPDVRLLARSEDGETEVALGIELKGWYLFSKEGEPSFRYKVTPAACAPQDLLVVVPWRLKNVLSGEPVVLDPYIEQAGYVAEYRNWWWENGRATQDPPDQRGVDGPDDAVTPYPSPKDRISDRPIRDGGGNFGRIARISGLMDGYVEELQGRQVAGIPARDWILFFRLHAEARDPLMIHERLRSDFLGRGLDEDAATEILEAILRIVARLG